MLVLPSDHRIGDEITFRRVLDAAGKVAAGGNSLVTIGIRPTGPETGYGYIEQGDPFPAGGDGEIRRVRSIREKPPLEQAREFLRQGRFLWNSGMFVWKASTILSAIKRFLPELHAGLQQIREALGNGPGRGDRRESLFGAEGRLHRLRRDGEGGRRLGRSGGISTGPTWEAGTRCGRSPERMETGTSPGSLIGIDAFDSLVHSPGKLVALVGVRDLLVVETDDALLICRRGRSQDVRKVVEILERKGLKEYL